MSTTFMNVRTLIKETVYAVAAASGLPRIAGSHRGAGLLILTYHSVGPAAEHPYLNRMPADRFARHLRYLKSRYRMVSIEEGLSQVAASRDMDRGGRTMVAVSVDDGYADNYSHVFPIVRREGVPVAIFLATDYIESGRLPWPTRISALIHFATVERCPIFVGDGPPVSLPLVTAAQKIFARQALHSALSWLDQTERDAVVAHLSRVLKPRNMVTLSPLSWGQVREMVDAGVTFGSHTRFHGWLDRVTSAELERELVESKDRIEAETGRSCYMIAYPNGNHNTAVRFAASRAGYRYALSQDRGINRFGICNHLALHRVEIPFNELCGTFVCRVGGLAW